MSGSQTLASGISWILRAGVVVSLVLEAAGILLNYASTAGSSLSPSGVWQAKAGNFFVYIAATLGSATSGITSFNLVALGIVVLMLTPYIRVIAAFVYYVVERDWKYVGITAFVTAVITLGLAVL